MAFLKFQDMRNEQETIMANAVGSQIKQLGEAVNRYISVRYDKLSTLSNATGTGTDPGPRTCNSSGCEISYKTLINEGFLPVSYTGENLQKSSYKILLRRDGTSPNYVINGLVVTSTAWKDGTKIRYDLLGKAMMAAGIDSGMTRSATVASGYGGQWNEKSSDYNNITAEGLLAYRVGYDSSMYSVYLRRDGTLPMTGDLYMGGNSINNVKNITASGTVSAETLKSTGDTHVGNNLDAAGNITAGKNINAGNWLIAHNGGGNTMYIGGDNAPAADGSIGNDYEIRMDTAKSLTIWNTAMNPDRTKTVLEVWGTQRVLGNLSVSSSNTANGYISASGNITGNRLISKEYLQINGVAVEGESCESNGLQGRGSAGMLLSCVSGVWRSSVVKGSNTYGYWQKNISTGLITQWGRGNADGSKTFPVAFTDMNSINLSVTNCGDMGRNVDAAYGTISSKANFYTRTRQSSENHGYTSYPICWLAVGY